ncbi:DnaJ-domain-containing protein [Lenzites betulinus]|nr:DnaJ-domain-containing protein [Lenzites betulinus]
MDDREDPIAQFFPDPESVDLYDVLTVKHDASPDDIKKAYRRLALRFHPDKLTTASEGAKADASTKFQQVGFAYAVLSDEARRKRYDQTGKTDEGADFGPGEDGWEAYFEELYDRVTRDKLDEMKKEYQGSAEEVADLKKAYTEADGDIEVIMTHIPHSTHDDEGRFIIAITDLIKKGDLTSLPKWESSTKDEKAKLVRKKQAHKEAAEAEALAKELGVWDEFFGSGKPGARKTKGKGKGKAKQQAGDEDEEDTSALQALILKKQKNMDSFFDGLAAKYADAEPAPKGAKKGRKRGKAADEEDEEVSASPKKKAKKDIPPPPEIDEAEFERIQRGLMDSKAKRASEGGAKPSTAKTRTARGRKAK